jgi:hypothetical protein
MGSREKGFIDEASVGSVGVERRWFVARKLMAEGRWVAV